MFADFFMRATGFGPHPYQARVAEEGLPDVLRVPMGAGKSKAVVLAWLWRLLQADAATRRATPRRLIVALPMRTLVDQFESDVIGCLEALDLLDRVGVYVVMGGRREGERAWRMDPHRPSIIVGTVDSLVSKALNRGYGISRSMFPVDFALVNNGAHIVVDEVQLAAASTATLRQLAGFRRLYPTAEPSGLTCMSATVDRRLLDTVDNPADDLVEIALGPQDHHGRLGELLASTKHIQRVPGADPPDEREIATHAVARHRPGSRTLVVVNTVKAAKALYKALLRLRPTAATLLIHARFRAIDRAELTDRLTGPVPGEGLIVVATQVVEAGVDIDSAVLITESAPWPSLCQRSGRCNRYAKVTDAELWWFPALGRGPYDPRDLAETDRVLTVLEGQTCTGLTLLDQQVAPSDLTLRILRRPDFLALFDTAPDLSGVDIDVAPYIRDGADPLDCQIAWLALAADETPDPQRPLPDQALRCPVPVGEAREWARTVRAWVFDVLRERWQRVVAHTRLKPGDVIIAAATSGGYDPAIGFDPTSHVPVPVEGPTPAGTAGGAVENDFLSGETTNTEARSWQLLDDHLRETEQQAAGLVAAIDPRLPERLRQAIRGAALTHDVGKLFPGWQEALRATDSMPAPEGLLAKSPGRGRLVVASRDSFRHELLSALAVSQPAAEELRARAGISSDDLLLVRYLVAAHHGKVRLQVRQPSDSLRPAEGILGLRDGDQLEPVTILSADFLAWTVDLSPFQLGAPDGWTSAALDLLDTHGPFVLAYLEMIVRVADWRASAGHPVPVAEDLR